MAQVRCEGCQGRGVVKLFDVETQTAKLIPCQPCGGEGYRAKTIGEHVASVHRVARVYSAARTIAKVVDKGGRILAILKEE